MGGLLDTVIAAHGGLERWRQLDAVSARLTLPNGGFREHPQRIIVRSILDSASTFA